MFRVAFAAEDKTDWFFLPGFSVVLVQVSQIQSHLSFVCWLELAKLEIDRHKTTQTAMEEEEVDEVVLGIYGDALLAIHEGKVTAQFLDKLKQLVEDAVLKVFL